MAKKGSKNPIYGIFGIKARTKEQKRLIRWFVVIKTITYLIIFVMAIIFLLRLKNMGK